MAISITKENFRAEIYECTIPIVIDVFATWCGPCKSVEPIFTALEQELGDRYKFAKLNVDEARDISIEFGITSVPTFLFIKSGKIKAKETGYMNKEVLREKIEKYLN